MTESNKQTEGALAGVASADLLEKPFIVVRKLVAKDPIRKDFSSKLEALEYAFEVKRANPKDCMKVTIIDDKGGAWGIGSAPYLF